MAKRRQPARTMASRPEGVVPAARAVPDPAPSGRFSRTSSTPVPGIWSAIGDTLRRDGRFVEFRLGEVNDWVLEVWRGERCMVFARLDAWSGDRARLEPWLQQVPTGSTLLCLVGDGYPPDLGTPLASGVFDILPPA